MTSTKLAEKTIAFVGSGNMGSAMIAGLLRKGLVPATAILAIGPREERGKELQDKHSGLRVSVRPTEACTCDIIVLSVKPKAMASVLAELRGKVRSNVLIISIAAGISVRTITEGLSSPDGPSISNVVRCMPNTPGRIGRGITGWTANSVDEEHLASAREIIRALGRERFFKDEDDLHTVTGLSGTGPAYFYLIMEAMIAAAVREGMSHDDALDLVLETAEGTAAFARESKEHLAALRDQVTSPGGTTAAALYEIEKGRLRTVVADAIRAACERSIQLGGKK